MAILRVAERGWHRFRNPSQVIQTCDLDQVQEVLEQAEAHADQGGYAVGFVSYEASPAFEPKIPVHPPTWPVLAWFALYDSEPDFFYELEPVNEATKATLDTSQFQLANYKPPFNAVKKAISEGGIYQANLTFRLSIATLQPPLKLFGALCGVNPPPYAAYICGEDWEIMSLSPELFFERKSELVTMRPMKGTASAPVEKSKKDSISKELVADPKTIAENIMIVDMVRNDLGRVAEIGSVHVPVLLNVEEHRTVLQVTSTVEAQFKGKTSDLIATIFPPASVTGAPKIAACEYIHQLETSPRHVYCGAIGSMGPGKQAKFSVGIRTSLFKGNSGEYGVGSGVVWDSSLESEYQECLIKAKVVESSAPQWALLESLSDSIQPGSPELKQHLARLRNSADFFSVPFDEEAIVNSLALPRKPMLSGLGKLRLTLSKNGEVIVEHGESLLPPGILKATLADQPVSSTDIRRRHKTTSRSHYREFQDRFPSFDEVLLFNERGEIVSFCNGNAIFEINGQWISPSLGSGCLEGIGLWKFSQSESVEFRAISVEEGRRATRALLSNAVVGTREVNLERRSRAQK